MINAGHKTFVPDDVVCNIILSLGNYCSIASGLTIVSGQHPPVKHPEVVSTYAFRECGWSEKYPPSEMNGIVWVGSDVWIGEGVSILEGVTVGSGSILAAGSVVSKDVPPYAVVAGNPAEVKKYRFSDPIIERLLDIAWWDWPDERVAAELQHMTNINDFLAVNG